MSTELPAPRPAWTAEPRLFENAQVLHHPEAGHVDALAQLSQRPPVPLEEPVQQLAAVRVGEGLEHVVHAGQLCDQMVTCQPPAAAAPKVRLCGCCLRLY